MVQYSLGHLATLLGATLKGGDPSTIVHAVAPLSDAGAGQLAYLADAKYRKYLKATQAEVVLLGSEDAADCPVAMLIVDQPAVKFAHLAKLFERQIKTRPGIHPTAVVGELCDIDATVSIGAQCVIGDGVKIGRHSKILPGTVIGDAVSLGEDCLLHARVTVYPDTQIGSRVVIHSGAVIGSDGFGNANAGGKWLKLPQLGRVVIGDDVDIGANTTIDCGAIGDTVIEEGVKIDNQIQIGHNVRIGAHTAIAAQVGIAGSTTLGKYCMIAGQAGITGHITICDRTIVSAASGVSKSITQPGIYSAHFPAVPIMEWNRKLARMLKVDQLHKRVVQLEKAIKEVEKHELD